MNFTEDQLLAINTDGCDILVSAAAGSGKTAVLTSRVLKKIIDTSKSVDITDFLVVTFTISAAAELKTKLSNGIRAEMAKEGADVSRLRRQLLSLSYAKIATIDSFCLFIVKDCLTELGLPVGMSIGDSGEMDALALEIMEDVLEEFYARADGDNGFLLLAETYSDARGDSQLIPKLLEIYNHLISFPRPMELLEESRREIERVFDCRNGGSIFDSPVFAPIREDITERINQACEFYREAIKACAGDEDAEVKYIPVIEEELRLAEAISVASGTSYEAFHSLVSSFTAGRMPSIRGRSEDEPLVTVKNLRTNGKDIITSLKKEYLVSGEDELYMQTEIHLKVLSAIDGVLKRFHERFMAEKKSRHIMSFSDASHYAFSALVKDYNRSTGEFTKTPYAESLTRRFSEILIDEYQDVNELQDMIFRAISNGHNRFMVGDIKQSIYAFRGATPKIFEHYRDTFKRHTDKNEVSAEAKSIFLQNNYRSDSRIIELVNLIFSATMNWNGEKYLDKDALVHSASDDLALPVELVIFDEDASEEECAEAEYIADEILTLVSSGEYKFEDIAVLGRSAKILEKVKEALDSRNLPADSLGSSGFFESYEVLSMISMMRAVANPTDDVYLVSAMTTLPFSFTPDELYKIRSFSHKTDFWFALERASKGEDNLSVKCLEFIDFIDRMRDLAGEVSCDRVFWRLTEETGIFTELEKLSDPKTRRDNLITLYSMSRAFCHGERRSLGAFCDYLDNLSKSENAKSDKKQISGAVRLMTFHGSKGLQFPVCFVAGLGQSMNKRDSFSKTVFSSYGPTFDLPYSEACTHLTSYLKKSASAEVRRGLIDEELRTLYVALTRAKKRMYITGDATLKSLDNAIFSSSLGSSSFAYTVKRAVSHMTFIAAALAKNQVFLTSIYGDEPINRTESEMLNVTFYKEYSHQSLSLEASDEECRHVDFRAEDITLAMKSLHHSRAGDIPFKISVSDIKEGLLDEGTEDMHIEFVSSPDFLTPEKKPSPAFVGTSMHTFMQFCSFDIRGEEECRKEAERLLREGYILPEHFECLDFSKLARIFDSRLLEDIRRSPMVEREKRYTLVIDAARVLRDSDGTADDKVLLQGVIDCYFENEEGGITLVDFKTDRVKEPDGEAKLIERHSEQLKLYAEALSEILTKKVTKILIYSFALDREVKIS